MTDPIKLPEWQDAVAKAYNTFAVAYTHNVVGDDLRHEGMSWKVYRIGVGDINPFTKGDWLGEFDNKPEAYLTCLRMNADAILEAVAPLIFAAGRAAGYGGEVMANQCEHCTTCEWMPIAVVPENGPDLMFLNIDRMIVLSMSPRRYHQSRSNPSHLRFNATHWKFIDPPTKATP